MLSTNDILNIITDAKKEIKNGFYNGVGFPIWNAFPMNPLFYNCLPASFSGLKNSILTNQYPNAQLVIGFVENDEKDKSSITNKSQRIIDFMAYQLVTSSDSYPDYHAWIDLDGVSLLDITGPIYYENAHSNDNKYYYPTPPNKPSLNFISVLIGLDAVRFYNKLSECYAKPFPVKSSFVN